MKIVLSEDGEFIGFAPDAYTSESQTLVAVTPSIQSIVDQGGPFKWEGGTLVKIVPTLEEARSAKKTEISAARYAAEFGGFTDPASGLFVRTDERTRSLLTAAKLRAQANAAYTVPNWKTTNGSFITLDAPTIIALETAVHDFIEAQFAKEAELTAQIDSAATTTEEVSTIVW